MSTTMGPISPVENGDLESDSEQVALLSGTVSSEPVAKPAKNPRRFFILALMGFLIMLIDIGGYIEVPPQTQIFENNVCRRYYRQQGLPVGDCKTDYISKEVALLNNIQDTVNSIPGIVLALPYGVLADRIGRKPMIMLCMLGFVLSEGWIRIVLWWWETFPPRLVWLGPIANLIGGGSQVAASVIFTVVSDVFPQEERANVFFVISAMILTTIIFGTPIGAKITATSPWTAFMIAYAIIVLGAISTVLMPETLQKKASAISGNSLPENGRSSSFSFSNCNKQTILKPLRSMASSTQFVWTSRNLMIVLVACFSAEIGKKSLVLMVLYAQRRFNWPIPKGSNIITLIALASLIAYLGLPFLTKALQRRLHLSVAAKDLLLVRAQVVLLCFGMGLIAFSATPEVMLIGAALFGLGCGYQANMNSLITTFVTQEKYGTLYAISGTFIGIGNVIAGPLQAGAWNVALDLGGVWLGMPFLVAVVLYAVVFVILAIVKLPKDNLLDRESEHQE